MYHRVVVFRQQPVVAQARKGAAKEEDQIGNQKFQEQVPNHTLPPTSFVLEMSSSSLISRYSSDVDAEITDDDDVDGDTSGSAILFRRCIFWLTVHGR